MKYLPSCTERTSKVHRELLTGTGRFQCLAGAPRIAPLGTSQANFLIDWL